MSRRSGEKAISRVQLAPETLAAPRRQTGCEIEGQPSCRRGLLAPEKLSLPVASFVALSGRDETLSNSNVSPGHHAEPPSPAESKRPVTLAGNSGSLPLKTSERTRAGDDVLHGAARGAPVTGRAGAKYWSHNVVIA